MMIEQSKMDAYDYGWLKSSYHEIFFKAMILHFAFGCSGEEAAARLGVGEKLRLMIIGACRFADGEDAAKQFFATVVQEQP